MAKPRPTWTQKLNSPRPHEVTTIDKPMPGWPASDILYPTYEYAPRIIDGYLRSIPEGHAVTTTRMREDLAKEYGAETTCALTAGIFLRIASEAALEAMAAGAPKASVAPFWRMVERKAPLAKKLSCGPDEVARLRVAEGLTP